MTKQEIVDTIKKAYEYRVNDDLKGLSTIFATDGTFRFGGIGLSLPGVLTHNTSAQAALTALIEHYAFRKVDMLDAVVDGDKAAIHSCAQIALRSGDGQVHSVELFDLVTFDGDGRIRSFVQFLDAAFVAAIAQRNAI